MKSLGVLAATVHILDPTERTPLVLLTGDHVTDSAVAEQITNPRCWEGEQLPTQPGKPPARKAKPA